MQPRLYGFALAALFLLVSACSGGGGGSSSTTPTNPSQGGNNGGGVNANAGATLLGPNGSVLFIPSGALSENTPISVGHGQNIPFPTGVSAAGAAIEASPAGLLFNTPATIGVPVDVASLPLGVEPQELRVYAREADGTILSVPVVGYDDTRKLLYARIQGFTTFQAAVPMFDFAIVPQTIRMGFLQAFYSETLSFRNNTGAVRWEVVSTMQTAGDAPEVVEPMEGQPLIITPPNEVAPGLTLSSTGTISGFPTTFGTWAFTLRATDSDNPEPKTSEVSHTITISELQHHGVPGTPNADESILKYDDEGNGFVLIRDGASYSIHKLPHDAPSGQNIISRNFAGGGQPTLAVAPDGSHVVVVYEVVVGGAMDIFTTEMRQFIQSGPDGMVDGLRLDLRGNGMPDLTVSFAVEDPMMGFTGSDLEIHAFAAAINQQLAMQASPARAVANGVFSGISIVDNGANMIGMNGVNNLRILPGGDAPFGGDADYNFGGNANNQHIHARLFNGDLMPIGGAFRVDDDYRLPVPEMPAMPPVPPAPPVEPEPIVIDPTLSNISRRASNPAVAFAQDRSMIPVAGEPDPAPMPPPAGPPPEPEPPIQFFVAYEMIRNLDAQGALRSDIYGAWFDVNGRRVSAETRLDNTSDAGDSPGQRIAVAGNAAGAQVLWVERGGDNAGTNPLGSNMMPSLGSHGDLASVMIGLPTVEVDPMAEGFGQLVEITVPDPTFLNAEATTTALHPVVAVSRTNQVFAAWSERNDEDLTDGPATLRKDISLMVSDVTGGGAAGAGFMVDDAPLSSLVFATALAVKEDGTIAVAWVEEFGGGLSDGYLRRFTGPGAPIENPIEISWNRESNLDFLPDGRISILSRSGGSIARLRTEAIPTPPMMTVPPPAGG